MDQKTVRKKCEIAGVSVEFSSTADTKQQAYIHLAASIMGEIRKLNKLQREAIGNAIKADS